MTFTPPTPPTPPAPAVRPTPPQPPRIDVRSFANDSGDDVADEQPVDETGDEEISDENSEESAPIETQPIETPQVEIPQVNRKVDDNESMARDAVAHGSGALTKRTVDNGDTQPQQPQPAQVEDTQSDYDRGQDVLRQFRDEDARAAQQQENSSQVQQQTQTITEQPRTFKPTINYHEGHGGAFWIGTIIFVAVASFIVVKKFLFTDKPALTKSELFADTTDRLQAAADKVKQPYTPPKPVAKPVTNSVVKSVTKPEIKPVTKPARPSKDDDDKGKHFEIRI